MKKEFICPEIDVIELEAQDICAGSTPLGPGEQLPDTPGYEGGADID